MSLKSAHGAFVSDKCPKISQCSYLSVAEYKFDSPEEKINSFEHEHEAYEFLIPLKTISLLSYDKAVYIGEVGFVYPVNPFVAHGLDFNIDSGRFYSVVVARDYVEKVKKKYGLESKYFYARFFINKYLINLIRHFQVLACEPNGNKEEMDETANAIVEYLVEQGLSLTQDLRRPEKQYAARIKKMIIYMNDNFHNPNLTIAEIAEISGYSLSHFSKAFKLYMGHTPIAHLNRLRLSEARYLLYTTQLPFKDIALKCGFKNVSTFTESFKQNLGLLPKDYRKRY